MSFLSIVWDDSEGGNLEHIAQHGVTMDEVEHVLLDPNSTFDWSAGSRRRVAFGYTSSGRYLMVAFDELDEWTVYPITAYDVPEP